MKSKTNNKRRSMQSDTPSPKSLRQEVESSGQGGASSVTVSDYANLLSESFRLRIDQSGAKEQEPEVPKQEKLNVNEDLVERRKKIEAKVEQGKILQKKLPHLQSFWDSITPEAKKQFIQIGVEELRNFLRRNYSHLQKIDSLIETFNDAVFYGEKNNSWEAWPCSYCDNTSTNAETHVVHVMEMHGGGVRSFPHNDYDLVVQWGTLLLDAQWQPLNLLHALSVIEKLAEDCSFKDIANQNWPVANHPQRATLLDKIRNTLIDLMRKQCLTPNNISTVTNFATEELKTVLPPSYHHHLPKIERSHIPLCFLSETDLKWLLDFFRVLSNACDSIEELPDKDGRFATALSNATEVEVEEKIVFSDDRSRLLLDQSKAFMEWLFHGGVISVWEELHLWENLKLEKKNLITEFLQAYKKTGELIKHWENSRSRNSELVTTLASLMDICDAEDVRRRELTYEPKSYTDLMKIRQEEITGEVEVISRLLEGFEQQQASFPMEPGNGNLRQQRDVCDAEDVRRRELTYEPKSYTDLMKIRQEEITGEVEVISRLLEGFEQQLASFPMEPGNGNLRQQRDVFFKNHLKDSRTSLSVEWNIADMKILKIDFVMENLSIKFEAASSVDYRAILLPIIKSYLQEKVEEKAKKKEAADNKDAGADTSVVSASKSVSQQSIVWFNTDKFE